jgi:ATP synthase protein I
MSDQEPSLDDLDRRLKAAHERHAPPMAKSRHNAGELGVAMRVSVDIVVGIGVGVFIGWGVDFFAGTGPWGLIVGFVLGSGAGINNVMRTARRFEAAIRAAREAENSSDDEGPGDDVPDNRGSG